MPSKHERLRRLQEALRHRAYGLSGSPMPDPAGVRLLNPSTWMKGSEHEPAFVAWGKRARAQAKAKKGTGEVEKLPGKDEPKATVDQLKAAYFSHAQHSGVHYLPDDPKKGFGDDMMNWAARRTHHLDYAQDRKWGSANETPASRQAKGLTKPIIKGTTRQPLIPGSIDYKAHARLAGIAHELVKAHAAKGEQGRHYAGLSNTGEPGEDPIPDEPSVATSWWDRSSGSAFQGSEDPSIEPDRVFGGKPGAGFGQKEGPGLVARVGALVKGLMGPGKHKQLSAGSGPPERLALSAGPTPDAEPTPKPAAMTRRSGADSDIGLPEIQSAGYMRNVAGSVDRNKGLRRGAAEAIRKRITKQSARAWEAYGKNGNDVNKVSRSDTKNSDNFLAQHTDDYIRNNKNGAFTGSSEHLDWVHNLINHHAEHVPHETLKSFVDGAYNAHLEVLARRKLRDALNVGSRKDPKFNSQADRINHRRLSNQVKAHELVYAELTSRHPYDHSAPLVNPPIQAGDVTGNARFTRMQGAYDTLKLRDKLGTRHKGANAILARFSSEPKGPTEQTRQVLRRASADKARKARNRLTASIEPATSTSSPSAIALVNPDALSSADQDTNRYRLNVARNAHQESVKYNKPDTEIKGHIKDLYEKHGEKHPPEVLSHMSARLERYYTDREGHSASAEALKDTDPKSARRHRKAAEAIGSIFSEYSRRDPIDAFRPITKPKLRPGDVPAQGPLVGSRYDGSINPYGVESRSDKFERYATKMRAKRETRKTNSPNLRRAVSALTIRGAQGYEPARNPRVTKKIKIESVYRLRRVLLV